MMSTEPKPGDDGFPSPLEISLANDQRIIEAAFQRFIRLHDIAALAPATLARDAYFDCAHIMLNLILQVAARQDQEKFYHFLREVGAELRAHEKRRGWKP